MKDAIYFYRKTKLGLLKVVPVTEGTKLAARIEAGCVPAGWVGPFVNRCAAKLSACLFPGKQPVSGRVRAAQAGR